MKGTLSETSKNNISSQRDYDLENFSCYKYFVPDGTGVWEDIWISEHGEDLRLRFDFVQDFDSRDACFASIEQNWPVERQAGSKMNLWDWKSRFYDEGRRIFPFNLILDREVRNLKELLSQVNRDKEWVLDLGTGPGLVLRMLHSGSNTVGLDRSTGMIAKGPKSVPQ